MKTLFWLSDIVLRMIVYLIIAVRLMNYYVAWNFRDDHNKQVRLLCVLQLFGVRRIDFGR